MNTSMYILDFFIFTAAAVLGFIIGATFVDSEFEKDVYYLSAEVENLNDALDALTESYEQAVAEGDRLAEALQRAINHLPK